MAIGYIENLFVEAVCQQSQDWDTQRDLAVQAFVQLGEEVLCDSDTSKVNTDPTCPQAPF